VNKQINQEAAEWFVEIHSDAPDAATRKRFDDWLRASPEHVRAFLDMVPIWEDAAQLPLNATATADEFVARIRGASNVMPIRGNELPLDVVREPQAPVSAATDRRGRLSVRLALAAGIAAVLASAAAIWGYQKLGNPVYETGVGEQRSLILADNSTVQLDALSRVRVRYSRQERSVELQRGRALFEVAKNTARPFVVYSDKTSVRAVGTKFDVYRKAAGTLVTVVEGRVAVSYGPNLTAGEQVLVGTGTTQTIEHPNLAGVTAWTQRKLAFDSTPLAEVSDEFNRYNQRLLIIDSAGIGAMKISGLFSSADPGSLLRFLRAQPGIKVAERDDGIHISGP
jgi:transmembrane sensor